MATEADPKKLSWADQMENEDNADDLTLFPLPPRQVIGPDENGIKKVIEYKFNEAGNMVKVTSTFHVRKVGTKMRKGAIERRSWAKFGDAVDEEVGSRITMVSTEEIFLERSMVKGREVDETKAREALGRLGKRAGFLMSCRTCGKKYDHFTCRCPYKDLAPQSEPLKHERPSSEDGAAAFSETSKNSYVPPSTREGAKKIIGTDMRRRNEENSIRVTNLSLDAQESDLHELFRPFGPIARVFVAPDYRTRLNRGFAFVSFVKKEDAERAINSLNGYGYDNLILKVEWSLPRSK
ncbi:eukaryotic translation initiation factor 3 subunit G-A-like [Durio zibethinus]|uniref:Eukaryotic translation initiation factor 3 subunit G n=1 Tax=Durio zibethinus TaxID=66656 RepID=A0A6P5ZIQ2_DURZI|nr:eukaryotic translation initiation factor 3 subunit G-A-like [Durio zibethinus]